MSNELEQPDVVAWMWRDLSGDVSFNYMHPEGQELMTVAQHERIVESQRFERQQMDRAFTACINERDAAQARLAELEQQVPDINAMVSRFLCWKLPQNFYPDSGISFTPPSNPNWWPVGTNLFTAIQAKAMFEHALSAAPQTAKESDHE